MATAQNLKTNVPAWGVDLDPKNRPGVPMETAPYLAEGVRWTQPERQVARVEVLKRADLGELTPVFGTCQPPRGLSGVIRRLAYKIPEHRASHWILLLVGDRVDAVESSLGERIRDRPAMAGAVIFGLASVFLFLRPRRAH